MFSQYSIRCLFKVLEANKKIKIVLRRCQEYSGSNLLEQDKLSDFFDYFDFIELIMDLEKEFLINIDDNRFVQDFKTAKDFIDWIESKVNVLRVYVRRA